MDPAQLLLLLASGLAAGVVNTLAGGGSLLTVPLLVLFGLPGSVANGTNRVGVLVQSAAAAWRFRAEGISGFPHSGRVLAPLVAGSFVGALTISRVSSEAFERLFGIAMLLVLVPTLRRPGSTPGSAPRRWSPAFAAVVFFAIGLYGGAFQAGVGIALLFALARAGFDLVRANAVKVVVITAFTLVAVPVFAWQGQVAWLPAGVLAVGFTLGAAVGVRIAVRGGERVIRPVLALAVLALAGRMLGLY